MTDDDRERRRADLKPWEMDHWGAAPWAWQPGARVQLVWCSDERSRGCVGTVRDISHYGDGRVALHGQPDEPDHWVHTRRRWCRPVPTKEP